MPVRATAKKPTTTSNRNGLITDEEEEDEEVPGTQFEAHESDSSSNFYNVIRILKESNSKYQVEWDGIDPKTGKPWKPSWIPKEDCTNVLIREWKTEKQKRKQEKKMKKKRKDGRGEL
ncbi:hypothetical protein FRC20_007235 [Serendipita sp. 405]|nr:hypothetical protein FRC20_007235 [Serendipita sp. 405]